MSDLESDERDWTECAVMLLRDGGPYTLLCGPWRDRATADRAEARAHVHLTTAPGEWIAVCERRVTAGDWRQV